MGQNKEQKDVAKARVAKLVDLGDYQTDSVVSRTLVDKKTGTVTFFAFDQGQGLSEHTAPYDALVFLLEGEAHIIISGRSVRVEKGEMVVIPAKKPHAVRAVKRFKMILTMIRS
jgi:quercetin dioxygenase-like cupin family protein